MKNTFTYLLASFVFGAPSLGLAAPTDCPDAPAVFGEAGAGTATLQTLADKIGTAGHDEEGVDKALSSLTDGLREQYPDASDAEVADMLIAAYCSWLTQAIPGGDEDQQNEQQVQNFEQKVYQIVFEGPPPPEYKRQGWLYGN